MFELACLLLAAGASLLGWALLALSLPTHYRAASGTSTRLPKRVRELRALGYTLLALSLCVSVLRDGVSFGSVQGLLWLSSSAWIIASLLTWSPRCLRPLASLVAHWAPDAPRT